MAYFIHIFLTMATLTLSYPLLGKNLTLKLSGKIVKSIDIEEMKTKKSLINVFDPISKAETKYQGIAFKDLLENAYGPGWRNAGEELVFTTEDGYQPSIPLSLFSSNTSFLAFSKDDGEFSMESEGKKIQLAPYYLIWENIKNLGIRDKSASIWPYQITGIDLVYFKEKFGRMAPSENVSIAAKEGFLVFREKCLSCHKMNGEGAESGIDLNQPVPKILIYNKKWFIKWILEPKSIRPNTTMPGLISTDVKATKNISSLIHYLEAMSKSQN